MNRKYNLKLDLQFRCNNSTMKFNQFDNNTSDFFMRITNGGKLIDIEKAIVVLATIKPSGKVASQFVEVKNGLIYSDLKASMKDEIGTYTAQAMLILEDERVVTDVISYEVEEDKIFSLLNDTVETTEEFTLLTDMLNRLSTIEISEEQRMINEAERILSEENRKTEEAKRVEAELIRQHEEADRAKYDATRESNENTRKQNEEARISSENVRLENEANRIEQEANRVKAEQLRKDNYNLMTEDEERRRSEANAHKEAEVLRVQAETNRVNEEAKRRISEQARVSAENTRVSNENTRKASEVTRQTNETQRVEAETQRQNRYNSFIADAEANASNFENYTNTAKVKEEERKSNELDRRTQETRRVSNEVERISNENTRKANENTRKANEIAREKNETSRQNIFENKVDEVDEKIVEIDNTKDNFISSINTKVDTKISELDTTKDNFVSSVNTKVDSKISELDNAKSDMTTTVSNKVNEVETRFNALTSSQQQDAEVIDARDGETSLKARLDRDIEKAKQIYVGVEGNYVSTDSSSGYLKDIEILGNTIQDASNLADIRSVGDKVEGQELYEIPVVSCGKNLFDGNEFTPREAINQYSYIDGILTMSCDGQAYRRVDYILPNTLVHGKRYILTANVKALEYSSGYIPGQNFGYGYYNGGSADYYGSFDASSNTTKLEFVYNERGENVIGFHNEVKEGLTKLQWSNIQLEEGTVATPYEPYQEDKLTILSPTPLEKVGDVADRIIEKDGVWGVEKNVKTVVLDGSENWSYEGTGGSSSIVYGAKTTLVDLFIKPNTGEIRHLSFPLAPKKHTHWNSETEGIHLHPTGNHVYVNALISRFEDGSLASFKKWLQTNPQTIKFQLIQPTFIPLPHDQQIKLRTFANKTNISFGCEIEGTIKAQVPKSLGATVNTHTEQINNLNKELDRVKKLEESTVSTVTTESDFTTVEATSNGYFEDVKLEGKTLVNLIGNRVSYFPSGNPTIISQDSNVTCYEYKIKPNTVYTIAKFISTDRGNISLFTDNNVGTVANSSYISSLSENKFFKLVTGNNDAYMLVYVNSTALSTDVPILVLEGDHTQNPPSYFEGLKSVGDTTDEIVVSSVNENLWLPIVDDRYSNAGLNCSAKYIDGVISVTGKGTGSGEACSDYRFINVKLKPNTTYTFSYDSDTDYGTTVGTDTVEILIRDMKTLEWLQTKTPKTGATFTTKSSGLIGIRFDVNKDNATHSFYNIQIKEGNSVDSYTPHQSDKKRLLYYNNETQTWEKPILREWDSIEKHADGKYYYHVRSIEEDYVEGDEIVTDYITDMTTTVKPLSQEKIYECTNMDLITYNGETNYVVNSGAIVPRTTLKVHNNISNVVSLLQKKVSLLESNVKASQEVQDMMILETDMRMLDIELALMEFIPMTLNLGGSNMLRSATYFNFLKNHIINETYEKEYLENVMNKYLATGRINQDEYNELYKMLYPPVYDIELPIEY